MEGDPLISPPYRPGLGLGCTGTLADAGVAHFARVPQAGSWPAISTLVRLAMLGLILGVALLLRLPGPARTYGTLGLDEARLTLAAQGIAEHHWPVFPTGKVYTRGLVQSLLMAPSLLILGPTDFAARLPSLVAGVLLVLVMYWYASSLVGRGAGLFAAALTATCVPFIRWSQEAWLYSVLLLLWVLGLYLFDRAVERGSARSLLLGAAVVAASLLAHELAALLLPAIAVSLWWWIRGGSERRGRVLPALGALTMIGAGLGLQAACTLLLRSDTLAGSLGEINQYLSLRPDLKGVRLYVNELVLANGRWILLPAVVAAFCLANVAQRRRLVLLLIAVLPLFVVLAFLLGERTERLGLALMPPFFLMAAAGLGIIVARLRQRLGRGLSLLALAGLCLVVLLAPIGASAPQLGGYAASGRKMLPAQISRPAQQPPLTALGNRRGWLATLRKLGYRPGDLVLTDVPPVAYFYLGRTDGWLRSRRYEKYATRGSDGIVRDIHTGGVVVRSVDEFKRQLEQRGRATVAWVISSNNQLWWFEAIDLALREYIRQRASSEIKTGGKTLYRIPLAR